MDTSHETLHLEEPLQEALQFTKEQKSVEPAKAAGEAPPIKRLELQLTPEDVTAARLRKNPAILDDFIFRQNFEWGHKEWVDLLDELSLKCYTPFHPDKIGLLLETRREELRKQLEKSI